jgi:hypothetical protein
MPTFLHLVKSDSAPLAAAVIEASTREPDAEITVILLDEAVPPALPPTVRIRRLGAGDLGYSEVLDLIFGSDHVITW